MIQYYENLKCVKTMLSFEDKLDTMADACHGIISAINLINAEPKQYQTHRAELLDSIGMLNVIINALEWQANDVSNESVDAIIAAEDFISANCIGATEAYMKFAKKAQAVFVEGLKEGMKGAR